MPAGISAAAGRGGAGEDKWKVAIIGECSYCFDELEHGAERELGCGSRERCERADPCCTSIGSGNWGSAIAKVVGQNAEKSELFASQVNMWMYEEEVSSAWSVSELLADPLTTVRGRSVRRTKAYRTFQRKERERQILAW